jgi:hypothetical protein
VCSCSTVMPRPSIASAMSSMTAGSHPRTCQRNRGAWTSNVTPVTACVAAHMILTCIPCGYLIHACKFPAGESSVLRNPDAWHGSHPLLRHCMPARSSTRSSQCQAACPPWQGLPAAAAR